MATYPVTVTSTLVVAIEADASAEAAQLVLDAAPDYRYYFDPEKFTYSKPLVAEVADHHIWKR